PRPGGHFLAFSGDGKRVAYNGEKFFRGVDVFDTATGDPVFQIDEGDVRGCDFSRDGKLIATITGNERRISIWDADTGRLVKQISPGDSKPAGAYAFARFSPDGKFLATGGHNADAKIWHVESGKLIRTLDNSYSLRSFSPDNQSVLHAHGPQA